jgi:hypothetical protein
MHYTVSVTQNFLKCKYATINVQNEGVPVLIQPQNVYKPLPEIGRNLNSYVVSECKGQTKIG